MLAKELILSLPGIYIKIHFSWWMSHYLCTVLLVLEFSFLSSFFVRAKCENYLHNLIKVNSIKSFINNPSYSIEFLWLLKLVFHLFIWTELNKVSSVNVTWQVLLCDHFDSDYFFFFSAEVGDYNELEHGTTYINGIKLLPRHVSFHPLRYTAKTGKHWRSTFSNLIDFFD